MKQLLKSSFRNFVRRPTTNLINLIGLSISLALVVILSIYCYSELTTDHFYKNGDRVYLYSDGNGSVYTQALLKDLIDPNVPGVESTVRISSGRNAAVFQVGDNAPITSDLIYADEDFFKLFSYQAVEGSLESSLHDPMTVVISEKLARKLFGSKQAIGETIKLNNDKELTVTAVFKKPETNTCLSFSAVTSNETKKIVQSSDVEFTSWRYGNFQLFVLLKRGADPTSVAKSILSFIPVDQQKNFKNRELYPFESIYFSKFNLAGINYIRLGDKRKITILLIVASLVLLIALVNFVNISSSQWMERKRQMGVMKVIGAKRSVIFRNVLVETGFFFLFSLLGAIIVAIIASPFIQGYTGIHYNIHFIFTPGFMALSVGATLVLSLLISIIPALRISSSRAVENLKSNNFHEKTGISFRGIFATAQFIVAIALIAFTVLVHKQIRYSSNLGFNRENIVGIKLTPQLTQKKEVLKQELMDLASVKDVSFGMYYPGKQIGNLKGTTFILNGEKKKVTVDYFISDASIFKTMGLQLSMGRFFSNDLPSDKDKLVVNEAFLRKYGITNPIGGTVIVGFGGQTAEVVGVIKDFYFKPVSQSITPLAIMNGTYATYALVKLETANFNLMHSAVQDIKAATTELSPSFPVEISFFNQSVENLYKSELQFRKTFTLFASSAIVICSMGILAMSLFACQRRIKEIGIRKVNGAKVSEVMAMLNKDFIKWVAMAFVVATPIAYYAMSKWLESFAYKTTLSWWIFALAGLMALGIALLTVSWQSWRAATRNPVEALRYE